jgi:hypothetical protein
MALLRVGGMTVWQPEIGLIVNGVEIHAVPRHYLNAETTVQSGRYHSDDDVDELIRSGRREAQTPELTTDARRWPNANYGNYGSLEYIVDAAGVVDEDLRAAIYAADPDGLNHGTPRRKDLAEWALCNVLDAAIDEQDRRSGRPVKPRTPWCPPTPYCHPG